MQCTNNPRHLPFNNFLKFSFCAHTKKCLCGYARWSKGDWKNLVGTSLCRTPIPLHYLPMPHHTHPHQHRMLTVCDTKRSEEDEKFLIYSGLPSFSCLHWAKTWQTKKEKVNSLSNVAAFCSSIMTCLLWLSCTAAAGVFWLENWIIQTGNRRLSSPGLWVN